jgi:hypothetical protein
VTKVIPVKPMTWIVGIVVVSLALHQAAKLWGLL